VSVLGRWKRESDAGNNSIASRPVQRKYNVQAELVRLMKENQRLWMKREILKKAAVFFASESGCGIK
jgi:transposase-like protein